MKAIRYFNKIIRAVGYTTATSFCKKNKKLWVFGAWKGTTYNDNSKYLFEYVTKNEPDIEAIWITKNEEVYNYLKGMDQKVELWPSKKAKYVVRHAGAIFQTEGNRDTGEYSVGRTLKVQLWHGIALKGAGWYDDYSRIKKFLVTLYADNHNKSMWCSTSNYYNNIYNELYGIPLKNFCITGYPRNDALVNDVRSVVFNELENESQGYIPVIYMPTHRNYGKDFDADFIINGLMTINDRLKESSILFYLKPHPNEAQMLLSRLESMDISLSNIRFLVGSKYDDVYSYLKVFRCLITDYSSVAYDYLVTDNPIVYFNYDMEKYDKTDAGIVKVYYEYQSGPFCKTWDETVEMVEKMLFVCDDWKDARKICRNYVNPFCDGNNCKRVVEMVKNRILNEHENV